MNFRSWSRATVRLVYLRAAQAPYFCPAALICEKQLSRRHPLRIIDAGPIDGLYRTNTRPPWAQ